MPDGAQVAGLLQDHGVAVTGVVNRPLTMEDVFVYRITEIEAREAARAAKALELPA